jgi:hypothetical protein
VQKVNLREAIPSSQNGRRQFDPNIISVQEPLLGGLLPALKRLADKIQFLAGPLLGASTEVDLRTNQIRWTSTNPKVAGFPISSKDAYAQTQRAIREQATCNLRSGIGSANVRAHAPPLRAGELKKGLAT